MTFNFRVTRTTDNVAYHDGLAAYLEARGPRGRRSRLCETIVGINLDALRNRDSTSDEGDARGGIPVREGRQGEESATSERKKPPAEGLPWVTPVLGSGCLPAAGPSPSAVLVDRMRRLDAFFNHDQVLAQLLSDEVLNAGEVARSFLASLLIDRVGGPLDPFGEADRDQGACPPDGDTERDTFEPTRAFAHLVEATAMLTRLYYLSKAHRNDAVTRWGDDVASLPDPADHPEFSPELENATVALRSLHQEHATELAETIDELPKVLLRILADLAPDGVGGSVVQLARLRFLTECIWHGLSKVRPPYPGWTDLLFELSLEAAMGDHGGTGVPRPSFPDLGTPGDTIGRLYRSVTEQAWEALQADPEAYGGTVHQAVAALLDGQSRLLRDDAVAPDLPMASAFVTTFDVELEMALLRRGVSFVVVFPVHVHRREEEGHASLHWLAAAVDPSTAEARQDPLSTLLKPTRVVPVQAGSPIPYPAAHAELAAWATVVRLSGSPLIDLPHPFSSEELTPSGSAVMAAIGHLVDGEVEDVSHAVLLDEYAAMHQTSADEKLLPDAFGKTINDAWLRYWMVLGVQLRDSAVRQRLTGHLGGLLTRGSQDRRKIARNGVFVNRSIEPEHRDLLYWYGFDVIAADCEKLAGELTHVAAHLGDPFRNLKRLTRYGCNFDERGVAS